MDGNGVTGAPMFLPFRALFDRDPSTAVYLNQTAKMRF